MSIATGTLEQKEADKQQIIDEEVASPEKEPIRTKPSPFDVYVDVIRGTSRSFVFR